MSHHEHPCIAVVLTLAWHPFIRVDTASEAVYELVADTISEPQAGEPQAKAAAEPEGGVTVDAPRRWKERLKCKLGPEMLSSQCKLSN